MFFTKTDNIFAQKAAKIAENKDYNIDPCSPKSVNSFWLASSVADSSKIRDETDFPSDNLDISFNGFGSSSDLVLTVFVTMVSILEV
jgi:hypothetical protein